MTDAVLIGVLFSVIQAAFWFWVKTSITKIENLYVRLDRDQSAFVEFKLLVADKYVKQSQLEAHMDRIDKSLDEIKNMVTKLSEGRNH